MLTAYPAALATGARPATVPGLCVLCGGRYRRGDRIAEPAGGGLAHIPCVAKAAG